MPISCEHRGRGVCTVSGRFEQPVVLWLHGFRLRDVGTEEVRDAGRKFPERAEVRHLDFFCFF